MKNITKLSLIFLIGSAIYIVICIFHYSPEKVRNNGISHIGEVIRKYKSDTAIVDGKRRSTNNVVILLDKGEEKTLLVNSIDFFTVGEEIPLWEYEGGWFVDKYGNMDRPNPTIAILIFIASLATVLYAKFSKKLNQ